MADRAQPIQSGSTAVRSSSPERLNGSPASSTTAPAPAATTKKLNRQRSSSLQKGAAVLRALSRAESDFDRQQIPLAHASGSDPVAATVPTQDGSALDVDDADGEVNANGSATATSLTKQDGLRNRSTASSNKTSTDRKRDKVKATSLAASSSPAPPVAVKSWEIPRKIFHSSIGGLVLYLYLSRTDLHLIVRNLSYFLAIVVTADVVRLNNAGFEALYEKLLGFLMRESEKEKVNGVVWYLVGVITSLHFFPEDIACVSIMILSWCDTSASLFGRLFGRFTPPLPSPPFARRKSTAGFLAAIVSGALTSYLFWCTSIASSGARPNGISWSGSGRSHPAVFGTNRVVGPAQTGWTGLSSGFLGQSGVGLHPTILTRVDGTTSPDVPGMPWWLLTLGSGIVAGVAEGLELGGVDDNLSLPILSATGIWAMLWTWGRTVDAWTRWIA